MIKKYKAILVRIKKLSGVVKTFTFELGEVIDFKAGQFINLSFTEGESTYKRPYSICSPPSNSSTKIELCIKRVEIGEVTPKLFEKKVGDEFEVMGPLGQFYIQDAEQIKRLLLVGVGTGIAPLRSILLYHLSNSRNLDITLLFGVKTQSDLLYGDEFENLSKECPNFTFIPTLSRADDSSWKGGKGYVQDNIPNLNFKEVVCFICGIPMMVDSVEKKLESLGVLKENIFCERYHGSSEKSKV